MTDISHHWLPLLADLRERRVPCVLITVAETRGSAPRGAGTKMIVSAGEQFGTIGGGNLETEAVQAARELLRAQESTDDSGNRLIRYPLGPALAQCCGGVVTVLLEPFLPPRRKLLLFGAGHVGKAVIDVLSGLGLPIRWIDPRAEQFPAHSPPSVEMIVTGAPEAELRSADADSFILIITHSHDLDYALVETTLRHGRFAYLGLIGSASKRARFEKRLRAANIPANDIARLTCPIGIAGITGKHPKEIAIAVAAQLLTIGIAHDGPASASAIRPAASAQAKPGACVES
ncbi:MAG: xanthine dehydrogenase accessory protein XdhC [Xanthomonadaceae bacterium]|nr:xanthine dehydrogenase accessory protein XdhC [Xanthomonadaceae bacterium]